MSQAPKFRERPQGFEWQDIKEGNRWNVWKSQQRSSAMWETDVAQTRATLRGHDEVKYLPVREQWT